MANIFLTYKCNRGCDFCFAKKGPWSESYPKNDHNYSDIKNCLETFNYDPALNGILGGEPFLYDKLPEIIELMWKHKMTPKIFTSGTNPIPEKLKNLEIKGELSFIVNVNEKETYSTKQYKNLIDFLNSYHNHITLSFTILNLAKEPDFLFYLINKYKLNRTVRIGVALPDIDLENMHIPKERYPEFGNYFMRFAKSAHKHKVKLATDCGFVACMFTPKQIGLLQSLGMDIHFSCGSAIDIGPESIAWNCFPVSNMLKLNALEFNSVRELKDKSNDLIKALKKNAGRKGLYEKCNSCRYMMRGQCDGGCLAFYLTNKQLSYAEFDVNKQM